MPWRILAFVRHPSLLSVFGVRPQLDLGAGRPSLDGGGVVGHGMCFRVEATYAWKA